MHVFADLTLQGSFLRMSEHLHGCSTGICNEGSGSSWLIGIKRLQPGQFVAACRVLA